MDTKNIFEPIPKRFMVWNKGLGRFLEHAGEKVYDLPLLTDLLDTYNVVEIHEDLVMVQSTNLFDEDNEEIFEGSIVQWGSDTGVVELYKGKWAFHVVSGHFNVYHELHPNADMVKVIGHILSSPELLETEE